MNLKNKIIVITGGSTGLGNKLAELFIKSGSKVVICSRKKPKNLLNYQTWKKVDISKQDEIKKFNIVHNFGFGNYNMVAEIIDYSPPNFICNSWINIVSYRFFFYFIENHFNSFFINNLIFILFYL